MTMVLHTGGCHCGRVRFEVRAPADIVVDSCNCSICSKMAFLHLIVDSKDFRLLQGAESLTTYTFNTGVAQHKFCSVCGVKSFYVPRSHPDGISVNARCLEPGTVASMEIRSFDGQNWEQNIEALRKRT
jgi:hypothetical protein